VGHWDRYRSGSGAFRSVLLAPVEYDVVDNHDDRSARRSDAKEQLYNLKWFVVERIDVD